MPLPGMHSGVPTDDALNLSMSERAIPLLAILFVKPSGIFGSAEAARLKEF